MKIQPEPNEDSLPHTAGGRGWNELRKYEGTDGVWLEQRQMKRDGHTKLDGLAF
jgi:hypothetical protein